MMPGPVNTGAPFPTVLRFVAKRTANTTGRYPCKYCCWSIANSILPAWISLIDPPTSKVPTFVPLGTDERQGIVTSGSSPRKLSRLLSALNAAFTFAFVPGMSDFAFGIVRTLTLLPPRTALTPEARCCKPELLASWITTRTFLAPAFLNCFPAPLPATSSVWPTWTSYVGSESNAPRPELTVMISIPFFEAFVSGSLSALASGTDVAITCAPAPIAALIPATCLATSLLAYTCVTLTPRDFRSFLAWSTPRLKTDQNEPVSPCVTTATLMLDALAAPSASATGAPKNVAPAATTPPLMNRSRRLRLSSSSSTRSSSLMCTFSFLRCPFPSFASDRDNHEPPAGPAQAAS